MFYLINSLWNYTCLFKKLYANYSSLINKNKDEIEDTEINKMVQELIPYIDRCGCVCIKFTQWLTPMLEMVFNPTNKHPYWLRIREKYYENCVDHSLNYTLSLYEREFGHKFNSRYEVIDIIGSGSIGQVYKIKSKETNHFYAMKVFHPNVKYDMWLFKYIVSKLLSYNTILDKINQVLPMNIVEFIDDFEKQTDMYLEANNLLRLSDNYKDNEYIHIPRLIGFSENILLMTYEEGSSIDDLYISDY